MQDLWISAGAVRLFAVEDGAGQAVVMLHGPMADHRAAWPMVAPLAARYRVVAPDLRGSGRSHSGGPLSFARLSEDLERLFDHLGVSRAVVGGVSGGSGVALHFALTHPHRVAGLVLVKPVYAGADRGYTEQQQAMFAGMDALASRALADGVQVLRPLYANLPPAMREKALAMLDEFDPASVVATSRFVASSAQPFAAAADLASLQMPVLLVRGDDPIHPPEVSELYATHVPGATVLPASTTDVAAAIEHFVTERVRPNDQE